MKRFIVMYFVLLSATLLWSQENRWGIGVDMVNLFKQYSESKDMSLSEFDLVEYPMLYGVIITDDMRIEPEIGFRTYHLESDNSSLVKYSATMIHIGLGIAPILRRSDKSMTYFGGRFGLDIVRTTIGTQEEYYGMVHEYEMEKRRLDYSFGPCIGAEYNITDNLTLGGEFQFLIVITGNDETEYNNVITDEYSVIDNVFFKSKPLVFLRWFF